MIYYMQIIYVESGLATMKNMGGNHHVETETIFGALALLAAILSQQRKDSASLAIEKSKEDINGFELGFGFEESRGDEAAVFLCRECYRAWAMLATSLGHTSFMKSELEKVCFLDNAMQLQTLR